MKSTDKPALMPTPFAQNGLRTDVPALSQISVTKGAASYNDGFPPLTMTDPLQGGIPPFGKDMNGILYALTVAIRWMQAGGSFTYDKAFANDLNVGGYPQRAVLLRADGQGFWFNTVDNNTTDPDATDGSARDWIALAADWNAESGPGVILNRPALAKVATSGDYDDLTNRPQIPNTSNFVSKDEIGIAGGVASLDADAQVPATELPVGTNPGQIVQLDEAGRLPAVDGSQLTGISSTPDNLVLNGNFSINQRQYVSGEAASLGSSAYRHDGWQLGSYTFAQSTQDPRDTTVTITGSTPLVQVIDGTAVAGGTYILSWTGSALGRLSIGANNAPTGVPQPSPIIVNNVNPRTGFQIDFQPGGTLGQVQLIPGNGALPFARRPYEVELLRCYRKSFVIYASRPSSVLGMGYVYGGGKNVIMVGSFPFPMSGPPSFQGGGYDNIAADRFNAGSVTSVAPLLGMNDVWTNRGFELNISLNIATALSSGLAMGIYTQNTAVSQPVWFLFES